jgi:hypothetical protein
MATNTPIYLQRTTVAGKIANTTHLPTPGQVALNLPDQILYASDGSIVFEVGANVLNQVVRNNTAVGNSTANLVANSTALKIANSTAAFTLTVPTAADIAAATKFLRVDGTFVTPAGGGGGPIAANTTIDFGATPTDGANATITNASISPSSIIQAFIIASDSTANNNANNHQIAAAAMRFIITPGTGNFNLETHCMFGLANGQFNIRYTYQ